MVRGWVDWGKRYIMGKGLTRRNSGGLICVQSFRQFAPWGCISVTTVLVPWVSVVTDSHRAKQTEDREDGYRGDMLSSHCRLAAAEKFLQIKRIQKSGFGVGSFHF